ncbi:putative reverse transcriptase domain-containing protein, partial [Tanacetum coccineum]
SVILIELFSLLKSLPELFELVMEEAILECHPSLLKSLPELFELVMEGAYGCILGTLFHSVQMVGARGSTPEFSSPAFEEVVQRAVDALLPGLTARLTSEIFDAKNWIAHIKKTFEVLGCADKLKARLASYKLEGDALNWWKAFKQAKEGETYVATLSWKDFCDIFFLQYFPKSKQQMYEREYHTIRQRDGEPSGEFMKRFLRLAGFLGKKAGTQEEQAKNFKWALCDWILDGIVNTEFTDVAQVANAARNIEILCERTSQNNKRDHDGDRQKGYSDYASSSLCDICGKLHPGKACHRVTGACFTCSLTGYMARDCPKNGGNDGKGNGNDNQPATKGWVFSSTKDQVANSSDSVKCSDLCLRVRSSIACLSIGSVWMHLRYFVPFSSGSRDPFRSFFYLITDVVIIFVQ